MTQKLIKNVLNEIFSKAPKKKNPTSKTDVYHIDDIWSLDILDLKDYGSENNRRYRYFYSYHRQFLKIWLDSHPQNKNAQTIKDSFESILISSKRKPGIIESDRGKEFYTNIFQDFSHKTISKFNPETQTLELFPQNASIVL